MKIFFILVHGFNVMDNGFSTVGKFKDYLILNGYDSQIANYGFFGLLRTVTRNNIEAKKIASLSIMASNSGADKVVVINHSNGALITHLAVSNYKHRINGVVSISPALEKDILVPSSLEFMHVYYSEKDIPVKLSKFIPFHKWGEMGAKGYQGNPDPRVTNFNRNKANLIYSAPGHSDLFKYDKFIYWKKIILDRVNKFYSK